jgi:hypothetical protein
MIRPYNRVAALMIFPAKVMSVPKALIAKQIIRGCQSNHRWLFKFHYLSSLRIMEKPDKIVVYAVYDLIIDANIAKTKLDAYGIPCFLTNENLASLYPMHINPLFGIRLMVFEKDCARVKEILEDQADENKSRCPFCQSKNVHFETSGKIPGLTTLVGLVMGFFSPPKRTFVCRDCEREFDTPDNF